MDEKECTKCGEVKEFSEFYKKEGGKNGLRAECKKCNEETKKKYREKNKEKIAAQKKEYWEKNKKQLSEKRSQYYEKNKKELNRKNREYYKKNRKKILNQKRKYYEDNKDRIKKEKKEYFQTKQGKLTKARSGSKRRSLSKNAANDLTLQEWKQILEDQDNKCSGCNRIFTKQLLPQKDHILPISRGGGLTKNNVQALCGHCNNAKHNKTMEEWLATKERMQ